METIGEYLNRVRKTCGYSLEDVAGITKINLRYLEAIEHDDLAKLPGDTFYQGFVRSFAKCIGIRDEEIVSRIRETAKTEPPTEPPVVKSHSPDDTRMKQIFLSPNKVRVVLPVAAGIIATVLLLIVFIGGRDRETIRNSKESREVSVGTAEVQTQVVHKVIEPFVIKIYAKELTWIGARIDDKETKDVILKPGEGVMWNGENKIVLTFGNAGGIDAQVNGKTLEPFGKSGEVVRDIVITSTGVSMDQ